ncbi:hypothetical protein TanjilG_28087 [Lupinus angustifolius]|uniref:Lil3 protein n=1 Tax=Lupinus angustifolius TaxID=3871 RepID=A0A4P1RGM8_LUPAN|nr:PREDICTED: light-harvesting complex-like protein 3 isotype 2, chloroplastic [Lupinus angustifolius]OIW10336.1 hypothetical protein TanjilG_28087 [Lupinus angustifolius]
MSTTMASFSPPTHFSSSHSKPHHLIHNYNFITLKPNMNNFLFSPLKASTSDDNNGVGATAVEPPLEPSAPVGNNGSVSAAATVKVAEEEEVKVVSGFTDPRWVEGTWDLKQFKKDGTTDWDAVIDAEARRRKWLEDNPESSSNDNLVVFDTSIVPWWAWVKRFHLPEAELLNGRAAMVGFFMAYFVDSLTGVGLVDQMGNFFCKTLLFIAVVGVLLIRKNEDIDTLKKLFDETTFYDKQWQATWQDENSSTSIKE